MCFISFNEREIYRFSVWKEFNLINRFLFLLPGSLLKTKPISGVIFERAKKSFNSVARGETVWQATDSNTSIIFRSSASCYNQVMAERAVLKILCMNRRFFFHPSQIKQPDDGLCPEDEGSVTKCEAFLIRRSWHVNHCCSRCLWWRHQKSCLATNPSPARMRE